MPASRIQRFLHVESSGGIVLLVATGAALVWANSPWSDSYRDLWQTELALELGGHGISEDLRHWVNDGLMAVFFFVVGLEIKRELVHGHLAGRRAAVLPAIAALGGMVLPAAIYTLVNHTGEGAAGWGIPMATDIAFAVGLLALLGPRVPESLKVLLLALAIVEDIGAIAVIAVFYSEGVELAWLAVAIAGLLLVGVMRRAGLTALPVYLVIGIGVWFATFESGIHATIAGVALGLLVPAEWLEDLLHAWTSFVVVPLFALANAGLALSAEAVADAGSSPVALGVVAGLLVGKSVGITGAVAIATRWRVAALPADVTIRHVAGVAMLAGIGFTVSLFVTGLAFDDPALQDQAKLGVLVASVAAAVGGTLVLRRVLPTPPTSAGS